MAPLQPGTQEEWRRAKHIFEGGCEGSGGCGGGGGGDSGNHGSHGSGGGGGGGGFHRECWVSTQ
jgi:hypothetical protein